MDKGRTAGYFCGWIEFVVRTIRAYVRLDS